MESIFLVIIDMLLSIGPEISSTYLPYVIVVYKHKSQHQQFQKAYLILY